MPSGMQGLITLVIAAAVFGLVLAVWLAMVLWKVSRDRARTEMLQDRLQLGQGGEDSQRVLRLWRDGTEAGTMLAPSEIGRSLRVRMRKFCREAGLPVTPPVLVMGAASAVGLILVISYAVTGTWLLGLGIAIGAMVLIWAHLKSRINRRESLFETQLVEALGLASRSLRAGYPLLGTFQVISKEMAAPIGDVFSRICQEQSLGKSLESAIEDAARECDNADMSMFATSVIIQLRSGGNLAEMMERLAEVIRDRTRLSRRLRVAIAQTQFSKRILLAMPFVMFILLNALSPKYMELLYTTTGGKILLAISAALLLLGAVVMNHLAVLRY